VDDVDSILAEIADATEVVETPEPESNFAPAEPDPVTENPGVYPVAEEFGRRLNAEADAFTKDEDEEPAEIADTEEEEETAEDDDHEPFDYVADADEELDPDLEEERLNQEAAGKTAVLDRIRSAAKGGQDMDELEEELNDTVEPSHMPDAETFVKVYSENAE
jgi:hypothetical protein